MATRLCFLILFLIVFVDTRARASCDTLAGGTNLAGLASIPKMDPEELREIYARIETAEHTIFEIVSSSSQGARVFAKIKKDVEGGLVLPSVLMWRVGKEKGSAKEALIAPILAKFFSDPTLTAAKAAPLTHEFYRRIAQDFAGAGKTKVAEQSALIQMLRNKVVEGNLRFAVSLGRDYKNWDLAPDDRIQAANLGLIKAAETYEIRAGFQFSAFAAGWIKSKLRFEGQTQARSLRLPVQTISKITKMKRAAAKLRAELRREPTQEELATELKISLENLLKLISATFDATSLETPLSMHDAADFEFTLGASMTEPDAESPESSAGRLENIRQIRRVLPFLDLRARDVLIKRFGLNGKEAMTLREIGDETGISRERIRQLEEGALIEARAVLEMLRPTDSEPVWTRENIVLAIRALHKAGVPLDANSIKRESIEDLEGILRDATGFPASGRMLHEAADRFFENWRRALRAAAID